MTAFWPTLAERIASGPIAIEALRVAREVAEAFEAAHEKGIIHRDLKPTNVNVTPEGKVKGLAKALGTDAFPAELPASPTIPIRSTRQGLILGTAVIESTTSPRETA